MNHTPADDLRKRSVNWLSPWCKCICTAYPDGTMCELCGHAHEVKKPHLNNRTTPSASSTWTADLKDVIKRLSFIWQLQTSTRPKPWPKKF